MRETIKLPLLEFINKEPDLQQFKNTEIELYADLENSENILKVIHSNSKKFIQILYRILSGNYADQFYRKEDISEQASDVTAMKFPNGKLDGRTVNIRIYCKEFFKESNNHKSKIIIMANVIEHKTDVDKQLRKFINNVGTYEYEFRTD